MTLPRKRKYQVGDIVYVRNQWEPKNGKIIQIDPILKTRGKYWIIVLGVDSVLTPKDVELVQKAGEIKPKFKLYQKVKKIHGYKYPGVIVSVFETTKGEIRYVVEANNQDFEGMLHIFNEDQLEHER